MFRAWYYNVWNHRHFLKTGDWKYYYCSRRCFLSNQKLCRGH